MTLTQGGCQRSRHEVQLKTEKILGRCSGSAIIRLRVRPGKERLALRQPQGPQGPMGTRYDALIHSVSLRGVRASQHNAELAILCTLCQRTHPCIPGRSPLRARGVFFGESEAVIHELGKPSRPCRIPCTFEGTIVEKANTSHAAETVFGQSIFGQSIFGPGQFCPNPILANPFLASPFLGPAIFGPIHFWPKFVF